MKSLYFSRSKRLANSFVFILPLLILYEAGIVFYGAALKNTADTITKTPLTLFGKSGSLIFNLLVIVFLLVAVFYVEKEHNLNVFLFFPMLIESVIYALFIGYVAGFVVYKVLFPYLLAMPFHWEAGGGILLSIGAGVYEEIVFRLLLVSAFYLFITKVLKASKPLSAVVSIIFSALIFTIMHYIGGLSGTFTYTSFMFRMLSGIILACIFMFRGLGIAVYTHAIYNVFAVLKLFQG
ncbi:CPBP family glutamic-type intramembrane protease [Candidatus Kuenenia sp.]|uniref:CPBP family glutamic-type intramembrane protease n=1 Tax=Candidatus Kuenenia sp. TaxID=2499824 RepID=UPI003220840E